ncbi:hypothetical protein [Roseomonas elaeocarpi]|uniref:Secreted protein n=1 Tax=Roseomonas elaeocarpi TaxID=907779 RepID=A0ABV6JW06_9PROT
MKSIHRRALMAAAPALVAVPAAPVATAHPDAELLRLCAEHQVAQAAYERDGGRLEPEECPLAIAYLGSVRAIGGAEAHTLAGMLAKARAAKREALMPDGSEQPHSCVAADWAWDLLNDLLRLAGEA